MIKRREFLKKGTILSAGMAPITLMGNRANGVLRNDTDRIVHEKYTKLDKAVAEPVLKKELFAEPVVIEEVDLLHDKGNFICRVRAKNGNQGISVSNNLRMNYLYPIFIKQVAPYFIGKDARELDALIEGIYVHRSNYKLQNYALWVPVATVEFAILDLLGKQVKKPVGALINEIHNKKIHVYRANNFRGKSAEKTIALIQKQVEETESSALKFKVGGRMSKNADYPPNRSEKLIPMIRKTFGNEMVVYADSNGSYDVEEAVRIGQMMEEFQFDFFEEPVPFDWYEETLQVTEKLKINIAGGEQEASMHNFRWLLGNGAIDIVQPDIFYFGGMVRSMKVARMAHAIGKICVPHISGSGLGYLYMMHFVSALPNAGPYHEFKGFNADIPLECTTSDLRIKNGSIEVPTGPGLGIELDPEFIAKHKKVSTL